MPSLQCNPSAPRQRSQGDTAAVAASPGQSPSAGSCNTSPGRASVFALLADASAVAGAVGAVAGRASHYLPKPLARRRLSGGAPPPQLANVPVRKLCGEEAVLGASLDASLEELQRECQLVVGLAPALQRICIQEEAREPGLSGLLRSTATNLRSRQRLARQLADWSSFLLLPEGVSRELRGQGLLSWAHDNVWQQLRDRPPPRGTVRVLVATLDGRRHCLLVRSSSSLAALKQEVQRQAAVPAQQQRLAILERRALSPPQRLAWALLRLLLALLLWAGGWLLVGGRALLGLPPCSDVRLQLVTESGRQVRVSVSPDTTLVQLQRLVWEEHGEQLSLQQLLSVSPTKAGSSSPERAGADATQECMDASG